MPESLKQLINSISYLPGIGEKLATKLAFFLLNSNKNFLENFSENIKNIQKNIDFCKKCNSICDKGNQLCNICKSEKRNQNLITIVEEYLDLLTIEETGGLNGVYHVLGGVISPVNGIFIGDLKFEGLFKRIIESEENIELILATNPNIEGEATNNYIIEEVIKRKLKYKTKITKLSRGLSSGYIEYADNISILNALKERKEI